MEEKISLEAKCLAMKSMLEGEVQHRGEYCDRLDWGAGSRNGNAISNASPDWRLEDDITR